MKILISFSVASILYLLISPSWNLTLISFFICFVIFIFSSLVFGLPFALFLIFKKNTDVEILYFLKILLCVEISFLSPLILARVFQIWLAKNGNVGQWGEGALFFLGELTTQGVVWMLKDFFAMFLSGIAAAIVIAMMDFFALKEARIKE